MRNANAAAAWAEAQDTFSPINNCLRAVMVAYDVLGQIEPLARADATATEAWDLATDQHPGDRTPPRGALVCFPNWGAGKSGHIAIGLGGDRVRSTGIDSYNYFTGTIAEVAAACRNPYAGWVGDFAGRAINFTSTAGGDTKPFPLTPTPRKKDDMPSVTFREDKGTYTYALYDMYHWQETSDETVARRWLDLYGPYQTVRTEVWNWRSDDPTQKANKLAFPDTISATGWKPSAAELAAIGGAVKVDGGSAILKAIAAAVKTLLAEINKPRTVK